MSSARSSIPTVRTQLVALLGAQPAMAGIQLGRSHPGKTLQPQSVFLGHVDCNEVVPVARSTRVVRQEEYIVEVWIMVGDSGSDSTNAEATCFTLYGALEDLLATNPTLTQSCISATISHFRLHTAFDPDRQGWAAQMVVDVAIVARLV